ncbi:MAG: DUF2062 domain-containing protein [Arenicellales bacterium WSBS_2016_MAG_OTU3]
MSLNRLIRRHLPTRKQIGEYGLARVFGERIKHENLWHLNRRSVANAVGIGLFCAFIPVPVQIFIAVGLALWLRANLPLSVMLVCITNPLTFIPIFTLPYLLGSLLLGNESVSLLNITFATLKQGFTALLLGSVIIGTVLAFAGYGLVHALWRMQIIKRWRARIEARKKRRQ